MAKSYTDLEQSRKLAEFLPIESADMCYRLVAYNSNGTHEYQPYCFSSTLESDIPCWSLAALLEVIGIECKMEKTPLDQSGEFTYSMVDDYDNIRTFECGNPIDACVEMIIKLNELNLL